MSLAGAAGGIHYALADGVATIAIDRPERRNALDLPLRAALFDAIQQADRDPDVRALVLTGRGGHFCAGGDVGSMPAADAPPDVAAGRSRMRDAQAGVRVLLDSDKPVIAAVDGMAYGGGFGLALAADVVFATPRTRFALSFLRLALVPDCGAFYTLARSIGLHRARALMLSGEPLDGETARAWGLVQAVLPPDALLPHAQGVARALAAGPALATALTKRLLHLHAFGPLDAALEAEAMAQGMAFAHHEHRAAAQAFRSGDRRPPPWPAPDAGAGAQQPALS